MENRYGFGKTVDLPFDAALAKVTQELANEGFGALTEIDVAATLKRKLGEDVPPHRILGACNPPLAAQALDAEPSLGLLMPCNVAVREDARGSVQVEFLDPKPLFELCGRPEVEPLATEVRAPAAAGAARPLTRSDRLSAPSRPLRANRAAAAGSSRRGDRFLPRCLAHQRADARRKDALLAIEEIVAQRSANRAKRKPLPRYLVFAEQPYLEAFRAGLEVEIEEPGAEHHVELADLGQADHRVQLPDVDARARLFERLARRAGEDRLAVFEKTRGQRPQAVARLDRAPAKEDAPFPFGQAADDDLGILVVNRVAVGTDEPRHVVALGNAKRDALRSAMAAEFHLAIMRSPFGKLNRAKIRPLSTPKPRPPAHDPVVPARVVPARLRHTSRVMANRSFLPAAVDRYLQTVAVQESPLQSRLRVETSRLRQGGMQIGADQGALLAFLVRLIGARRAIEIGTFTGYSALAVASALPADGQLVCCDINEEWTRIARRYWAEAGVAGRIELYLQPAQATLEKLLRDGGTGTFDLAFIDADKTGYNAYYEACLSLLRPGGLVIIDNMLWGGAVADAADTTDDTKSLRALNLKIRDDRRVDACLLSVGDGVMLARKL